MSTPSARAGDAIRAHHRRLLEALERHLAALSARAAAGDGVAEAQALARFLAEALRPHARGEERALYPAVDPLVSRYARPTATMSIDHEHIDGYVAEIEAAARTVAGAAPEQRAVALEALLRRTLQLAAIFRLHLEKEDRVYLPLFEAHLSPEEQRRVLQAMHDEPASAPADGSPVVDVREPVVDVRELPPPRRHPVIFNAFGRLAPGQAFVLVNDHDPRPLYYQFAAELPGRFTWEYLEAGPEVWRVRIGKPAA